jgi:hypothetical protein
VETTSIEGGVTLATNNATVSGTIGNKLEKLNKLVEFHSSYDGSALERVCSFYRC